MLVALTVTNARERYLDAQVVIADQNAPIDHITAFLSKARALPVTQGSTVYSSAVYAGPGAA
jgi:hypothetical protein